MTGRRADPASKRLDARSVRRSGAADHHVADGEGHARVSAWQPLEIGADGDEVDEQALQARGNRDLPHGTADLSPADEESLHADGQVATDGIDARVEAGHRLHEE